MERVVRTAISLPSKDFASLELARKRLNKSRSEVMREALQSWLRRRKCAALEKKYVEGYRRIPEDPGDLEAIARAVGKSLPSEEW